MSLMAGEQRLDQATASVTEVTEETVAGLVPRAAGAHLERGAAVGRFLVLGELGAGGMGVVYEAYDPELDRKVAVKLVRPRATSEVESLKRARLVREARSIARLSHPNVVTVYDVGEAGADVFVAMELIRGVTLGAWLRAEPRDWRAIVDVFVQAGRGLAAGHAVGLVHRDFKPGNVIVGDDHRVRVIDFGLAASATELEVAGEDGHGVGDGAHPSSALRLTVTGAVVGTPRFLAPEQHRGGRADARCDQFSFCVALYEALYRQWPFAGETVAELAAATEHDAVAVAPADAAVPDWLDAAVRRGLARDAGARHPSMAALLDELTRDREARRRGSALRRLAWISPVVIGLGLGAAWLAFGRDEVDPCRHAGDRVVEVWTPAIAAAVRGALPGDAVTADRVVEQLDGRAAALRASRQDCCRATHVRHEQSDAALQQRMECLDRRTTELGALIELLRGGEVRASVAAEAVQQLTPPASCDDVAALRVHLPAPADPAIRARITAVRDDLARAAAHQHTGRHVEGLAIATRARADADAIEYAPLRAEALHRVAALQERAGDAEAALRTLGSAAEQAALAHDDRLAAEIATLAYGIVGYRLHRTAEARALEPLVRAAVVRAGATPAQLARLANARGLVSIAAGDPAAALVDFELAISGFGSALGADHAETIRAVANRGIALSQLGRDDEALAVFTDARERFARTLGPRHDQVGATWSSIGIELDALGRSGEAIHAHREAVAILVEVHGPDHPEVASAWLNLGASLEPTAPADALVAYQRAIEIRERAFGKDNPRTASALGSLASAQQALGKLDEAAATFARSLAGLEASLGRDHQALAVPLYNAGNLALDRGDHRHGRELCHRSWLIDEAVAGPELVDLSYALTCEAVAALAVGDAVVARTLLERSLALDSSPAGAAAIPPRTRAQTRATLARALVATGGARGRALALAGEAVALYAGLGDDGAAARAALRAWIRAEATARP